jgi:hypothetical protein
MLIAQLSTTTPPSVGLAHQHPSASLRLSGNAIGDMTKTIGLSTNVRLIPHDPSLSIRRLPAVDHYQALAKLPFGAVDVGALVELRLPAELGSIGGDRFDQGCLHEPSIKNGLASVAGAASYSARGSGSQGASAKEKCTDGFRHPPSLELE